MANLRLTNIEKQFNNKTPKNVYELSNLYQKVNTLYSDVDFDINFNNDSFTDNSINSNIAKKDLNILINEKAVINSVKNWFKTDKFCHLLNPKLSFGIHQYLFEQLNEYTAYFIASEIISTLPTYEPRVKISKCNIKVDYQHDAYIIDLKMTIPSLNNKEINFKNILSETGYSTL